MEWSVYWNLVMPNQSVLLGGQAYWTEISALLWPWLSACVTFVNKAREPAKATFLLSYLKAIGFMVMPWVIAVAGVRVRFPANRVETLFVTSAGNLAFAAFLNHIHRGIATAWSQEWRAMFSAGHLSSDWQAEVHVVDMIIFVATLERYRRSRQKPVMGQMSIKLLEDLKDLLATFVSTAMDQFLLQMYTQEQRIKQNNLLLPESLRTRHVASASCFDVWFCFFLLLLGSFIIIEPILIYFPHRGHPQGDVDLDMCLISHQSHVLMHPDSIWAMLEAAREKNCSLSVVAKLRRDEAQGGAHWASVEYWNRKVLSIYFGNVKTGFLNLPHINVVTDARLAVKRKQLSAYVILMRWTVVLFALCNMCLDPKSLPLWVWSGARNRDSGRHTQSWTFGCLQVF